MSSRINSFDIAARATLLPIGEVAAAAAGIPDEFVEPFGTGVAKIDLAAIDAMSDRPRAKYVLVTAVTPTPLGEGKTTTTAPCAKRASTSRPRPRSWPPSRSPPPCRICAHEWGALSSAGTVPAIRSPPKTFAGPGR